MMTAIPEDYRPFLRIGTCSWKYDSWKGLYYQEGKAYKPFDYLPDFARHLDAVEVDQWFWSLFPGKIRLPDPRTVQAYADSVPDDFLFTIKAPNALTLTHFYARQPKAYAAYGGKVNDHFLDPGLLDRFLELLTPMKGKLGPIMFQFEYLNRQKMPGLSTFLERLDTFFSQAPREIPYAIECRNPNYLNRTFFDFLTDRKLGFVYLEGYYMPHIGEVFRQHRPATAGWCVIRLHGGDRLEIERATGENWSRVVAPKEEGLFAAAQIVAANRKAGIRTFVNVNNHFEGSAPLTIERFLEVLKKGA